MKPTTKSNRKKAKAVDKAIGARIKARRVENEVTQGYVAGCIGVDVAQVSRYERGALAIKHFHLTGIARALKTTVADLLEDQK